MIIDKLKKRNQVKDNLKDSKVDIPVGKWVKCEKCGEILYKETLHENFSVCPNCGNHFRLSARRRIKQITDENSFIPFEVDVKETNPLNLDGYMEKLEGLRNKTGIDEAVVCGIGKINEEKAVICVMDGNFLMGSMGSVVGEKITYSIEKAIELNLPIIIFSVSGGARMQEGIISLMQMAKTSSAIAKLNDSGILFISVLTDPTYGGVTASFASLGDIILAEPKAMIGFAGPRVIKQTIGEELPEGFQTSEFLLEHGFVDKIVERKDMKETLYKLIRFNK
ncbi:MAG TPA: acetyl-CoA carboxylase carboxyltransferase subunit beta [Candidatus Scatovivens faecipullorum]|nr:acetyl-CoA carboxylase carboxyltransferase subunit beta [Candidatus Scatovivens faecipullorum]